MSPILRNSLPEMLCTDMMWILCSIATQSDWTHGEQVWVSGDKTHWNTQVAPICVNKLPDLICIDVMSTLFTISHQNDQIHNAQVWVSGYELHCNTHATPTSLLRDTAPDMIGIDVIWLWCSIATWNYWTDSGRCEFQDANSIGIIKSWLHLWIHSQIWCEVMWGRLYAALPIWMTGPLWAGMIFGEKMDLE